MVEGFRYVARRPDLKAILLMLFLVCIFGLNFPIFISTMCVTVFPRRGERIRLADLGDGGGHADGARCWRRAVKRRASSCLPGRRRDLRRRHDAGRPVAERVAVRRRAGGRRRLGSDPDQYDQQPDAAHHRPGHARPRPCNPSRDCARRHADRRARWLAGSPIASARAGPSSLAAAAALVGALVAVRYLVVHCGLRLRLDAGRPPVATEREQPGKVEPEAFDPGFA